MFTELELYVVFSYSFIAGSQIDLQDMGSRYCYCCISILWYVIPTGIAESA